MDQRIIDKKLLILQGLAVRPERELKGWEARTADHRAPGEYKYDGGWTNLALPARFPAGKTVFLQTRIEVPKTLPLAEACLQFDFDEMEGLLSVNGAAYAGIDTWHKRVRVPGHGRQDLSVEFMSVPQVFYDPGRAAATSRFGGGSLCAVNSEIEAFCCEVRFASQTANISSDPRRKALLAAAVESALLAVDLTLPRPRLEAEVARALRLLRRQIAAIAPDPEAGRLFAVGHSHIDTAWLWPIRETVRKCGRTFSTACRLMERYPDFHFNCSQPQLYRYTKEHYPGIYRQIKKWVKAGRWETSGAMWVEADCNVTSGESLIRQMLHGLEFFRQEFGTRPRMCWLPDVFGYPASLPEILAGCGVEYFYTYKLHWQATNTFPRSLFRWRGLDGTEIFAHVVNHVWGYNNYPNPEQLLKGWNLYAEKAEYPEVLFPFGFGDGGGGVTEDQLNQLALAQRAYPGLPAVRTGPAEQYFDDMAAARPSLAAWDGELYVETHRGTYTTQSAMKRANRTSELLLREAEIVGSLATLSGVAKSFSAQTLRPAWDLALLNQFHDILPGSSIGMVYAEALDDHRRAQEQARGVIADHLAALLPASRGKPEAVAVFNSLSWPRTDSVTARVPGKVHPVSAVTPDGTRHAVQILGHSAGHTTLLFGPGEVPALGYSTVTLSDEPVPSSATWHVSSKKMENRFFRIALNAAGGITRLRDKVHAREVLAPGAVGNDLQLLQDGPEHEDAWNIHETSDRRQYPFEGPTSVRVVETGPVRGVVRVTRQHRQSVIEQEIILYADLARIDFVTRVDWQERQTMLKAAFPLNVRATRATYEVQFGACERPTHRNTSWDQQKFEVPAHRWADLSEADYGVSLLNDSRYGYDAKDNVLRLTLLRSTTFPDPEADRGRHEFTYALLPHAGSWTSGQTVRRAWELNVPARGQVVAPTARQAAVRSYLGVEGGSAVVEALKPAQDGRGHILRIYEPHGGRGEVTIRLDVPVKRVVACNLVEEDGAALPVSRGVFHFALGPFQIRTFRLLT